MGDTVKDMTAKFGKLDKLKGNDFRCWQKKMHFLLTTLKVVYVLSTLMLEFVEDETLEQTRKRYKWENNDYICRGHILNAMSDALFDFTQHGLNMDESISVSSIIDKLPPSWKDFKHSLKRNKDELSLVQLGSHFRIEETLRAEESGKGKGKEIVGSSSVNMIEDGKNKNNNKNNKEKKRKSDGNNDGSNKKSKLTCWKTGHFKKDCRDDAFAWWIDSGATCHAILHETTTPYTPQQNGVSERKNRALKEMVNFMLSYSGLNEGFWGEAMLTACYLLNRLYLVEGSRDEIGPQYSYCYSIEEDPRTFNEAIQSRDVALWKEAINDEMDSIIENNTWILFYLPPGCKPLGYKWIFKRKMKVNGTIDKFKVRLVIQGFRQKEGIDHFDTYAPVARISAIRLLTTLAATYNLQSPKQWHQKFDEVVLSSGFVLNQSNKCVYGKFDKSGNGVVICLYIDDMLIFETDQDQVDKTKKFLSSNFSIKDMGKADVILGIRIKHEDKDQLEYSRAIGYLMYAMTSTRPDIAYAVVLEGYSDASWITNLEDHTSITGWVFLLGGGAISCASKKKTCITDSTMKAEFIALAAASKEAEWLRNLIYEIPLWPKPISPISIHCDSATTLAKAYCQTYDGKSRHLGVRHCMVRELITNGVIFVDFVRSQ
ncbi:zinc finger, CCHC-type containing protein [Tanacetum coccineum]